MFTKSSAAIALVAVSTLALSGCVKETGEFTVSKKQTVSGTLSMQISNTMVDFMQEIDPETPGAATMTRREYVKALYSAEDVVEQLPAGVTIKPVSGKKFSGARITFSKVPFKTANKVGRQLGESEDGSPTKPIFTFSLNKKKQVTFRYNIDALGGEESPFGTTNGRTKPSYKVSVTMPGKIVTTNGKAKKRTITWKGTHPDTKPLKLTAVSKRK